MQNADQPPVERVADRPPLHELIRDRLRTMIVRGHLSPGSNIAEAELAEQLGSSRTPLREALKLLSAEGLIELRSNRGAYVVAMEPGDAEDAFEVAAALEQLGAAQAAQRATDGELDRLRRLQADMEAEHAARRLESYFDANQAIHRLIVQASRNDALRTTHEMLFGRVERLRFAALHQRTRWDESIGEHREILRALEARDSRLAGAIMGRHVRRTGSTAHRALLASASSTTQAGDS